MQLKGSQITVSVIICTRDRPVVLRNCLGAFLKSTQVPDEVIVVDNTPGDCNTESLAREFRARYVVEPNIGLSHARNRGLAESKSEILVYIDDDAVPEKNWLALMLQPFSDPTISVVTGETVLPGAPVNPIDNSNIRLVSKQDPYWFEIAAFGGLGIGTNMALRKQSAIGFKLFDGRLGRGAPLNAMEENHAFVRLLEKGHRAAYVPNAIVIHPSENRATLEQDILCLVAYFWLLFFDFPRNRRDLFSFICRRLGHRPLNWTRNSPRLGKINTSELKLKLKAVIAGTVLFWGLKNSKDA
jgi:O-antigen biosynthesis protein